MSTATITGTQPAPKRSDKELLEAAAAMFRGVNFKIRPINGERFVWFISLADFSQKFIHEDFIG